MADCRDLMGQKGRVLLAVPQGAPQEAFPRERGQGLPEQGRVRQLVQGLQVLRERLVPLPLPLDCLRHFQPVIRYLLLRAIRRLLHPKILHLHLQQIRHLLHPLNRHRHPRLHRLPS